MTERGEAPLPGRLTIRAAGRKVVLVKRAWESERHVLLKALVFGLYAEGYPGPTVEPRLAHRYRPDLVALDGDGRPVFWAECGETGKQKVGLLLRTLPETHFVLAKQVPTLRPFAVLVRDALAGMSRRAPVDLLNFPPHAERFIGAGGEVRIGIGSVETVRL